MTGAERGEGGTEPVVSREEVPILARLGIEFPRVEPWRMALCGLATVLIGVAVFIQLFREGGLVQPGAGTEGSMLLIYPAVAALVIAVAADWRIALRALVSLPVLALVGLAALSWASGYWSIVDAIEADRLSFAILGYSAVAIAAAVVAARLSVLPLAVLLVVVAVVAGAMGLWGFANFEQPLAVLNKGELTPAGPFRYRNTLALLSACSLIPLMRWAVWDGRDKARALLAGGSGLALGVSVMVVATSGSDFAWLMTIVVLALVVVFPGRSLATSRQRALGMSAAVLFVGFLGWLMFRKVVGQTPGDESLRTSVMVGIAVLTPLLIWVSGFGAAKISDRVATRLVQAGALLAAIGIVGFVFGSSAPGDLTQSRQGYYEATIETAKQEPIKGFGAGSYAVASLDAQLGQWSQTRFAHSIPGEMWVELGIGGLLLSLLLYGASFMASWRTRLISGGVLLIPLVVGFLMSGLIDWSWHMTAMTALWASGLGGLVGLRLAGSVENQDPAPDPGQLSESSA